MTRTYPRRAGGQSGVHVWLLRFDRLQEPADSLRQWLCQEERDRAERFVIAQDQLRFIACRAALRQLLGLHAGASPDEISFEYGPYGKPKLPTMPPYEGIEFNVAHSGNIGCIAICFEGEVGVDVEAIRPMTNEEGMIRKTLSASERLYLMGLPPTERLRAFFRYWTQKEALAKAVGLGLQLPLDRIELNLAKPVHPIGLPETDAGDRRFYVHELELGPDYCGAVAGGWPERPQIRQWTGSEVVTGDPPGEPD